MADKTYRWYDVDLGLKDSIGDESRYSQEVHVTGGVVTVSSGSVVVTSIQDGGNSLTVDQSTHDNLNANANIQVGDADVSGTNPVPVYQQAAPVVTSSSGSGAISASYAPAAPFWLDAITLHLSAAPTTSQDFTITLNANDGAAYDTLLYGLDLSLSSVTDLVYTPDDGPLLCEAGDSIDVAWLNGDGRTFGLRIVARLA